MPLETATYVASLVSTNPPASDQLAQSDDHLRLIKSTLLATFPNLTGAVTATHTQLNVLATMTYPLVAADLASNSVTTAKITDANVTAAKIASDAVTTVKILNDNVTTAKILDANVTTAKLANNAVTTVKITDANVTKAKIENVTHGAFLGRLSASAGVVEECSIPFGQCRLAKVSSNLVLVPFNGNLLTINLAAETIPDAGVSLAPTGVAGTTAYVYAFMSAGTMTLETSTTVPAPQAASGVQIKTGDATRTLVGMVRPIAGPAWADSAAQRFVRSWFNDPGTASASSYSAARTSTSGTFAELNTEIRCEFLTWSLEVANISANGAVATGSASDVATTVIAIDGTTPEDSYSAGGIGGGTGSFPIALSLARTGLTEGYHYATLLGKVASGPAASSWAGSGTAGSRTTLKVSI